jgi:WD40 repeat protein
MTNKYLPPIRNLKVLLYIIIFLSIITMLGLPIQAQSPSDRQYSVDWRPHGSQYAVAGIFDSQFGVRIFNVSGQVVDFIPTSDVARAAVWSPDGSKLAITFDDGAGNQTGIWDIDTGQFTASIIEQSTKTVFNAYWHPDNTSNIIATLTSGTVAIWDTETGNLLTYLDSPTPVPDVVAFSWNENGTHIFTVDSSGSIYLWDMTTQEIVETAQFSTPADMALSPDGTILAVSSWFGDISLFDAETLAVLRIFPTLSPAEKLLTIRWHPEGSQLATSSYVNIVVWDTITGEVLDTVPHLEEFVIPRVIDYSPSGYLTFAGANHDIVIQPNADAGSELSFIDSDASGSEPVMLDGSASTDPDGTIVGYSWTENYVEIATGITPTVDLPVGEHTITLTVTDNDGLTASDTVVITVQAAPTSTRVTANLQALYTFDEGSGLLINDVSGVGAPMDLTIDNQYAVTWAADGLTLNSATVIDSRGPATKFINAARATNALTIEAWVTPANITQDGPARMVTLSPDIWERNITLGQGLWPGQPNDTFDIRLRTTDTSDNGQPSITSPSGAASTNLTHLVYTRDAAGTATLYVNNVPVVSDAVAGDFSNWETSYRLALGNEVTLERPWQGTYHLVALYNQALTPAEVEQNFNAGSQAQGTQSPPPAPTPMPTPTLNRVTSGLQAFYTFDEGSGYFIHDNAGTNTGLDLVIDDVNMVNWTTGGLTLTAPAMLKTSGPAIGIINAAQSTNEVTLEAWLQPTTTAQNGPARLISLSEDLYNRNFTLGHGIWGSFDTAYTVRLRTTDTSMDGQPPLETAAGAITGNLVHVVYTRDTAGNAALYVDGALIQTHTIIGEFSNWDASYRLLLGNELTLQRPWSGTYYLAAIYNRALTAAEVQQNYAAGHGN